MGRYAVQGLAGAKARPALPCACSGLIHAGAMAHNEAGERVAKLLSARGLCSRRAAETLIVAGQVLVNGVVHRDPGQRVAPQADICLASAGQARLSAQVTVLLHKPVGVVSTQPEGAQIPAWRLLSVQACVDRQAPGVAQVLARPHTLAVCGRLDQASRGLLVMSQDGVLAKHITGTAHWEKRYVVAVDRPVSARQLELLRALRRLDDGPIMPMQVAQTAAQALHFVLREGRKHQLRRACAAVGLQVVDLLREAVGPWTLQGLAVGHWKVVPSQEVARLLAEVGDP